MESQADVTWKGEKRAWLRPKLNKIRSKPFTWPRPCVVRVVLRMLLRNVWAFSIEGGMANGENSNTGLTDWSGIRIIASFFVPRPLICVRSDPSSWGRFVNCLQIPRCLYSRTACTSHRTHLVLKGGGDVRARVKKQFSTHAIFSKSFYEVGVDNYGERKKLHTGSSIIIC